MMHPFIVCVGEAFRLTFLRTDVGTSPYRLVFCSALVGEAFHRLPYIKFHFYKRIKTKTAEVVASAVFPKI